MIKINNRDPNHNLQMWPFEPAEEGIPFLRGLLEWMTVAKVVDISYILYVIAKGGNGSKEIGKTKKCIPGVMSKVLNRKNIVWWREETMAMTWCWNLFFSCVCHFPRMDVKNCQCYSNIRAYMSMHLYTSLWLRWSGQPHPTYWR